MQYKLERRLYLLFTKFGQHLCTLEAGPDKTKTVKTQDLFFTEPLIYGEMGAMSAVISKRHA